ncbi:hypothetical protein QTP88_000857 [Uroleucon formosanum]
MASNHLLSITSISEYFKEDIKQLNRGEIAYKDNHILKFQADPSLGIIVGELKPSMRNNLYNVKLFVKDGCIADAQCSFPRGTLVCHHIAALAIYTLYNLSSTDKACSWSASKNNTLGEIKSLNQINNCIPCPDTSVSNVDFDNFRETLMIKSKDFVALKNFVQTKIYVTDTVEQINNDLWFKYRKNRLTASHFGKVLAAFKKDKFSKSLFKSLSNDTNLSDVLKQEENVEVTPTGLWLLNSGLLGASPDELVGSNYTVEVKCP